MHRDLERGAARAAAARRTGELARFMEVLFDRDEREEAIPDDHPSGDPAPAARHPDRLEAPGPTVEDETPPPSPARRRLSVRRAPEAVRHQVTAPRQPGGT